MSSDQVVKIVDNRLMLNVEPKRKYPVVRSDNSITLYVNGKPRREPVIISNTMALVSGTTGLTTRGQLKKRLFTTPILTKRKRPISQSPFLSRKTDMACTS